MWYHLQTFWLNKLSENSQSIKLIWDISKFNLIPLSDFLQNVFSLPQIADDISSKIENEIRIVHNLHRDNADLPALQQDEFLCEQIHWDNIYLLAMY